VGRTDNELDLWKDFAMVNLLTNPVSPDTTGAKLLPALNNPRGCIKTTVSPHDVLTASYFPIV